MSRIPLTERVQGRWSAILPLLGLGREFLSGKHGPCPFCGGKDRFRWINRDGSGDWFCNGCGHGNGVDLAIRLLKTDFKGAAERIEALIGSVPVEEAKFRPNEKTQRLSMKRLWESARPLQVDGPDGEYLRSRGLSITDYPRCLRYVPSALYDRDHRSPAILCKVISADDRAVNLHRIFITSEGQKTSLDPARKPMFGTIPPGSAIRLFPPTNILGVAEGVETALAAAQLYDIPVWSLLDAGKMEKFVEPSGVEELVIFADNDKNFQGHASAYTLAHRAMMRKTQARVEIPPVIGEDWNDPLMRGYD